MTRNKKIVIAIIARYSLIVLLVLYFLGSVFSIFTNPEGYFFGEKLGGQRAIIYLSIYVTVGILIVYLLFKKKSVGEVLSVLYFGYFFIENLITNLLLGLGLLISPLAVIGLVISIILLAMRDLDVVESRTGKRTS